MDLKFGGTKIPPASLYGPQVLLLMLLIPFMDRIFYPLLLKYDIRVTSLRRIGIGMVFVTLSIIVAAVTEEYRRDHVNGKLINEFKGKSYNASSMSVFYLLPQYILLGFSEQFAVISGMEFAYSQSPKVLQGLTMGVFLATSGIGSFVGSALVNIVASASEKYSSYGNWYADDINKGRLDFFFYVLAGLMGVNIVIFCVISTRYLYVNSDILCEDEEEWKGGGLSTLVDRNLDVENESTPLLNSN